MPVNIYSSCDVVFCTSSACALSPVLNSFVGIVFHVDLFNLSHQSEGFFSLFCANHAHS